MSKDREPFEWEAGYDSADVQPSSHEDDWTPPPGTAHRPGVEGKDFIIPEGGGRPIPMHDPLLRRPRIMRNLVAGMSGLVVVGLALLVFQISRLDKVSSPVESSKSGSSASASPVRPIRTMPKPDPERVAEDVRLIVELLQRGKYRSALAKLERYEENIAVLPIEKHTYYSWYGAAAAGSGQAHRAQLLLQNALGIAPAMERAELENNLAYLLAERDERLDYAEKLARAAVAAQPKNPHYLDTLGMIILKKGMPNEAIDVFESAADIAGKTAPGGRIYEHLAQAYSARGDAEKASRARDKAITLNLESALPDLLKAQPIELNGLGSLDMAPTAAKDRKKQASDKE